MNQRPVIVVGTGRCGSTLLSQMVRLHPDLLSVSEVFSFVTDLGTRIEQAFPLGLISGRRFWEILATPQPRQSILLANQLQMAEVIYPWETGRFAPAELPPILQGMLPHLDGVDPDRLFDALEQEIPGWAAAPAAEHYLRLFRLLTRRFGKEQWVERSGGSLRVVERLVETFPDAAIVHLVRDGRDTALSMSKHIGFRMAILCGLQAETLGLDPYESSDRTDEADLSDELAETLPEHFTKAAFNRFDLPASLCGHYWTGEIVSGLKALEKIEPASVLTVRYEDLLIDSAGVLQRFGDFAGCVTPQDWLADAGSLVRDQAPRWRSLPADQRKALTEACRPGFDALQQLGLNWNDR